MTEQVRRSSWQAFVASDIDHACIARSLGMADDTLPEETKKELERICSRHYREGRLYELQRIEDELLALEEAAREAGFQHQAFRSRIQIMRDRIALARKQSAERLTEDR